jgi:hypothetical protein
MQMNNLLRITPALMEIFDEFSALCVFVIPVIGVTFSPFPSHSKSRGKYLQRVLAAAVWHPMNCERNVLA